MGRSGAGFVRRRQWWRDDLSPAQRRALEALIQTPSGSAYAANLRPKVRLVTLRALHRLGLVRADEDPIQEGTVVQLTGSGRDSIQQAGPV